MGQYSVASLNGMDQDAFTQALGGIFEHTPTIAAQAWYRRPFSSVTALHQVMVEVMRSLPTKDQLALICAHPDLGSRAKMAVASVQEQAGVGLDQLAAQEYEELLTLNRDYRDRFQFPFILAVKEHTKASILAAFRQRLVHDLETERETALQEIVKIARFRLEDLVSE